MRSIIMDCYLYDPPLNVSSLKLHNRLSSCSSLVPIVILQRKSTTCININSHNRDFSSGHEEVMTDICLFTIPLVADALCVWVGLLLELE